MSNHFRPTYVCVGGIIIDDIVFPTGETRMGVLGGGVTHAAAGISLWGHRPGLLASVGHGLPEEVLKRLERDFDLQGLVWLDLPQARAWQIFEWDGKRTEIFRVNNIDPFILEPIPDRISAVYAEAQAVHLLRDANLREWRQHFPSAVILWEPIQPFMVRENLAAFRAALPLIDIVSPNWLEAQQMYGIHDPADLIRAMLDDGASVAVLRMGEAGSMVGRQGQPQLITVPVVPVPQIIDQTGAGNTYCGGFLTGWLETHDLITAACRGAVAASFALEVLGVAEPPPPDQRDARYRQLYQQVIVQN